MCNRLSRLHEECIFCIFFIFLFSVSREMVVVHPDTNFLDDIGSTLREVGREGHTLKIIGKRRHIRTLFFS